MREKILKTATWWGVSGNHFVVPFERYLWAQPTNHSISFVEIQPHFFEFSSTMQKFYRVASRCVMLLSTSTAPDLTNQDNQPVIVDSYYTVCCAVSFIVLDFAFISA